MPHRCGTIAILGRPNVGKSTLLNRFLGTKIAVVSPKPETTRERLLGVLTLQDAQALFVDTPGIYRGPKTLLGKHQIAAAREALAEADVLLMLTDAAGGFTDEDRQIVQLLPKSKTEGVPAYLAINKVDRARKDFILPQIHEASKLNVFREIFPLSALKGDNAHELLAALIAALPERAALYPPDLITDKPARSLAQELIREKTLLFTHEEVPHAVAVLVEEWRKGREPEANPRGPADLPQRPNQTYIRATLYVERDSQKGILIGKGGLLLKKIGQESRKEIEKLLGEPVFLDLWVKVADNWRKDPVMLKRLGYG